MKRLWFLALLLIPACGPAKKVPQVSNDPVSVRGWIVDLEGAAESGNFRTVETEAARKMRLYQSTYVEVENAPYVSGGVAETTGAFLLLDVPPGNVTITFTVPGAATSKLVMQGIPGNADVYLPALLLKKDGVAFTEPEKVQVRVAASISKPPADGAVAVINGLKVPVMATPIGQLTERHDYPTPPTIAVPITRVK